MNARTLLALVLAPALTVSAQTQTATQQVGQPKDTRKSFPYVRIDASAIPLGWIEGGRLAVQVLEQDEGVDLNGDSDTNDRVLHTYNPRTERLRNHGVEANLSRVGGNLLATFIDEEGLNDLNGDGDFIDEVLHIYDFNTGDFINSGLAVASSARSLTVATPDIVAFLVSELEQGGTDLDGSGQANNWVVHLYDRIGDRFINLELAQVLDPIFHVDGTGITFRSLAELMHYDVATDVLTTTGVKVTDYYHAEGDDVIVKVYEPDEGQDVNGDGDQTDGVLFHFRPSTGQLVNLGVTVSSGSFHRSALPVASDGTTLFALASEFASGQTDLDGDGLVADYVLHEIDLDTLTVTNTEVSADYLIQVAPNYGYPYAYDGSVLFLRSEFSEGVDLNGDRDLLDRVLQRYESQSGEATNLGRAVSRYHPATTGPRFGFISPEGDTDLNGDGDSNDNVYFTYDIPTGVERNLGLASGDTPLTPDAVVSQEFQVVTVGELEEGRDLNGDGDMVDDISHYYRFGTGEVLNLRWPGSVRIFDVDPIGVPILVTEFAAQMDLDGDGSISGWVTYVLL